MRDNVGGADVVLVKASRAAGLERLAAALLAESADGPGQRVEAQTEEGSA